MLSIIIPTRNEATHIGELILHLQKHSPSADTEIIVSDGGSTDPTIAIAKSLGVTVIENEKNGRAFQMNAAAQRAKGSIFYFVHADTLPPAGFYQDIQEAVKQGYAAGRYRTKFNSPRFLLSLNAFFTRFDWFVCYGGDQTLFITQPLFQQLGGFNEEKRIMEDYDISIRIKQKARYKIFRTSVLVSARKYEQNSWWQVQKANYFAVQAYKKGVPTETISMEYKSRLRF